MFVNDTYKVLELIYEHSYVGLGQQTFCPINQQEVAAHLNISRQTVNKIFGQLKEAGYVTMLNRGIWSISQKAIDFIENTQNM